MVDGECAMPETDVAATEETLSAVRVTCDVCPHACSLAEGRLGRCRARRARGGVVVDDNYGRVTSLALDPMEKKPLARFMSGTFVASVGSYGCNLRCPFCQNASIACAGPEDVPWREIAPEELVDIALDARASGCVGIAYTYNEPLVGYEYVRDTGRLAHDAGLVNVLVSNGMVNEGPLGELRGIIDAANIDLKGFSQDFYDVVGGNFEAVKRAIAFFAADPSCHLEVTTLVVPGLNDDPAVIDAAASWLASLDADITYHISRFFPCHRMMDRPPTPVDTVYALADVARCHLDHVFTGNC